MKKENISIDQYNSILEKIIPILTSKGLKASSMDSIASSLQMSKRTLYEIFGNKEDMFMEIHKYVHDKIRTDLRKIFDSSENVMEAIIKCFLFHRDMMSNVNIDFIRDMEEFAGKAIQNPDYDRRHHYQNIYDVLQQGVKEGYFREDVNLPVQCKMLSIQMQALKHTQELFPADISLLDVYDSIIISFLRGISSNKGLNEIEKYLPLINS